MIFFTSRKRIDLDSRFQTPDSSRTPDRNPDRNHAGKRGRNTKQGKEENAKQGMLTREKPDIYKQGKTFNPKPPAFYHPSHVEKRMPPLWGKIDGMGNDYPPAQFYTKFLPYYHNIIQKTLDKP